MIVRGHPIVCFVGDAHAPRQVSFLIGAGVALITGGAAGLSKTAEAMIDPALQALRNVPSLAWVPFLLL